MNTEQANETIRRGYCALWGRSFEVLPGQPGITVYTKEADAVLEFAEKHGLASPTEPQWEEFVRSMRGLGQTAAEAMESFSRALVGVDWGAGDDRTVYLEVER